MISTWEEYDKEKSKKITKMEMQITKIQMLEIKIINTKNKLKILEEKFHDSKNEFTIWNLDTEMKLEESIGKRNDGK